MATINLMRAWVARTISGNSPQVLHLPEASSLACKAGEFVYLASGLVTEIGNSPTAILGMAMEDGHNGDASANQIAVWIANSDTIFCINKVSSAAGTAGTGGAAAATATADVGRVFGLYRDTTNNITHASVPDNGNPCLICLDHDNRDTLGDTGGRLLVMVAGNFRQLFSTS
jgi:hypothetical protein